MYFSSHMLESHFVKHGNDLKMISQLDFFRNRPGNKAKTNKQIKKKN